MNYRVDLTSMAHQYVLMSLAEYESVKLYIDASSKLPSSRNRLNSTRNTHGRRFGASKYLANIQASR
jgi:hypothetical protein